MITGFNTDIKHASRVFHVQTEDKGEENPYVESLVYVGGEIIASKKTPYTESLKDGSGQKAVHELMESQHRKMIAAIQRGRFDGADGSVVPDRGSSGDDTGTPGKPPAAAPPPDPEPVASGEEKTLDQVILDYLASEVSQEHLDLTLYSNPEFYLGETTEVRIKAETSLSRRPIIGAAVLIKVISTVDKPIVVYEGKTASDGSCTAHFKLPAYPSGNAALIIQAISDTGNSEMKYLLRGRRR